MTTPAETETEGMQALTRGEAANALELLSSAADGYRREGDQAGLLSVLGNLAFLHRQRGDLEQALVRVAEALGLPVPPAEVPMALVNCAAVLDAVGDARAKGVWMLAAQGFVGKKPLMQVVCLAHAIGADIARDAPQGLTAARALLAQVTPGAPPSLVAGYVAAIGESAGAGALHFFAQALWVASVDAGAFTATTVDAWAALLDLLGAEHPLVLPLCALALGVVMTRQGERDFAAVAAGVRAAFDRQATTRGLDAAAFAALVQQHVASLDALPASLAALVPEPRWVLPRPAPQERS
ncbi:MAG: hypothetical protein JNJ54_21600 [Myxococcaceae bacterium]|nr:hypothetical protein [Myxococcaceae bacterium]